MTRTEFDAAFKLALGYVISDNCFQWADRTYTILYCGFKKTGISFFCGNRMRFYKYDKLVDLIPDIKMQMGNSYVTGQLVNLNNEIYVSLER